MRFGYQKKKKKNENNERGAAPREMKAYDQKRSQVWTSGFGMIFLFSFFCFKPSF